MLCPPNVPNYLSTSVIYYEICYSIFFVNSLDEYLFSMIILYTYYNPLIPNKTYFVASSISITDNTILYFF